MGIYIHFLQELGSIPRNLSEYAGMKVMELMNQLQKVNQKLKKYNHVNKKAIDQYMNFSEQKVWYGMHSYIHTYTHTHIHTHIHTHAHTHTHTNTYTYTCTFTYTHTHIHTHIYTYTYTYIYTYSSILG
jgi:hypothetical protein